VRYINDLRILALRLSLQEINHKLEKSDNPTIVSTREYNLV
jgi:hypothetical protein